MNKRDYYDVLGVSRTASSDEIKRAHRKLAKQYHPDAGGSEKSAKAAQQKTEKFKEIQEAYDTLSDPEKRSKYDQFGHAGVHGGFDPSAYDGSGFGGFGGGMGGGGRRGRPGVGGVSGVDMGDVFEQLFGGMRGARGGPGMGGMGGMGGGDFGWAGQEHGLSKLDLETTLEVSLEQAAHGGTVPLRIDRGDGKPEEFSMRLPVGVADGSKMRLRGKGRKGRRDVGDLYVTVKVKPHERFSVEGLDLILELPVSVYDAMLGTTAFVPTLDAPVEVRIPAGTSSGSKLRLRGRGLERTGHKGDLLAVIKIVLPKELSEEAKAKVAELSKLAPVSVSKS